MVTGGVIPIAPEVLKALKWLPVRVGARALQISIKKLARLRVKKSIYFLMMIILSASVIASSSDKYLDQYESFNSLQLSNSDKYISYDFQPISEAVSSSDKYQEQQVIVARPGVASSTAAGGGAGQSEDLVVHQNESGGIKFSAGKLLFAFTIVFILALITLYVLSEKKKEQR
jgi:hypothetical protein